MENNETTVDEVKTKKQSKETSEIKKIAIDLGSSSLKIVGKVNGESKYKRISSKVSLNAMDTNCIVETTTRKLYFGVGTSLASNDKTSREYIEETILLATQQIYGDEIDGMITLDIALGLPLSLYKSEGKRNAFDSRLKNITNKIISGTVNGQEISIKINSIHVYAEGYSAFIALYEKIVDTTAFMILDIGYRTTDIISIDVTEDKEYIISNYKTINKGMMEVLDEMGKKILSDIGYEWSADTIENKLLYSPKIKKGIETYDINDFIDTAGSVVKSILNEMLLYFPDAESRNLYLVGGGSCIIDNIVKNLIEKKEINCDTLLLGTQSELMYANVEGYFIQLNNE